MKKVVFFTALLLILALAAPATAATGWLELSKTGAQCVGATADGERFLMVEAVGEIGVANDSRAYVADAVGDRTAELSLVGTAEVDILAEMVLDMARVHPDKRAAAIEEAGGRAALALRLLPWNRVRFSEASGDFILVELSGIGNLLVNAETGETALLTGSAATLAPDGTALNATTGALSVYDPAGKTYSPVEFADADWWTLSARRLSDGGLVCARRSVQMTALSVDFAFTYIGADGKTTETVPAGMYRIGNQPERFYYSEQLGVGIAYNTSRILSSPPLIFRRGWPSAQALLLDKPDSQRARTAALGDVLDETGMLKQEGECALLPLGISEDGRCALCIELKSAALLEIGLDTLEVRTVLADADFSALYAEKNAEFRALMTLSMLGWNGNDILAGPTAPLGCALKLG